MDIQARQAALSAREPLVVRLESLREAKDTSIARILCKDELCPPELLLEALCMLDGQEENDLFLCLANSVQTVALIVREKAIELSLSFYRPSCLHELEQLLNSSPERYLLKAVCGLGLLLKNPRFKRSTLPKLELGLVDLLSNLAGDEFLLSNISKNELMGSLRVEALAALCLRELGGLVDEKWLESALKGFASIRYRSAAVNNLLIENNLGENGSQVVLTISEAISAAIKEHSVLSHWNEEWYYGVSPTEDERAMKLMQVAHHFAKEALWLLQTMLDVLERSSAQQSMATCTNVEFILKTAAWCPKSTDHGLILPWITEECASVANEILELILARMGKNKILIDVETIRTKLIHPEWKNEWLLTAGFLHACLRPIGSLVQAETHLLPTLMPMADDLDIRISEPAWRVLAAHLSVISKNEIPLLLRVVERNLVTRDESIFGLLMLCLKSLLCEANSDLPKELDNFIEKLADDCWYLASTPGLYARVIDLFLVPALNRNGLYSVRLLNQLLKAVESGATTRASSPFALTLLDSIVSNCRPRIKAHRGRILKLYLQLATTQSKDVDLKPSFAQFRSTLDCEQENWLKTSLARLQDVNPPLISRLVMFDE